MALNQQKPRAAIKLHIGPVSWDRAETNPEQSRLHFTQQEPLKCGARGRKERADPRELNWEGREFSDVSWAVNTKQTKDSGWALEKITIKVYKMRQRSEQCEGMIFYENTEQNIVTLGKQKDIQERLRSNIKQTKPSCGFN